MKALGLFLSSIVVCAGCATQPAAPPLCRYGGPPMADPVNFDRAAIDVPLYRAEARPTGGLPTLSLTA